MIGHAIDIGLLTHDPSLGINRPKTQEIRAWTETEIAAFEQHWPVGTKQRLAFALMLYTGQRRSDVHRMTWADVSEGTIRVVQQKTGRKLAIHLHRDLVAVLTTAERDHVTIINTEYGKPFTVDGFSQWMRDAITAAGLPLDCQPHGCARLLDDGLPRRDALRMRSWQCLVTRHSPKRSVTRAMQTKPNSRPQPWQS